LVEFDVTAHLLKGDYFIDFTVNGELPKMNFENANSATGELIDINGLYGRSKGHSL
jgi:hypothetical protein